MLEDLEGDLDSEADSEIIDKELENKTFFQLKEFKNELKLK